MNQVELPAVKVLQRWLGLESYTEANAGVFHGRSRESEDLLRFVKRDVLTVVFGPSGTGKTSLLRAGLFPLLRQEGFLPVHIRLDHGVHAASYSAQVRSHLQQACSQQGVEEAELSRPLTGSQDETLWEYLHRTEFWDRRNRAVTPLLAFDQFEELFTVGAAHGGQERFLTEMADVIENYLPAGIRTRLESKEKLPFPYAEAKYKIVVILREEWVPRLDGLRKSIPSIMHNRFPLARMNGAQALEAVMGPGAGVVDGPTAEAVVRFVAASGASAVPAEPEESRLEKLGVEPSLLSLMCAELDRQRSEENLPAITTTKLQEVGANILDDFYERGFRGLKHQARVFVEDRLLTAKGFRGTVPKEDALRAGLLETEIGFLVDRRLIREEERLGIPHLEIIHDVLAKVAFRSRDARRERERLAASAQQLREQEHASRERRERRFKGALAFAALLVLLSAAAAAFSLYFLAEAKTARSEALKQRTKAGDAQKLAEDSLSKSNQLLAQNEQLLGAEKKALKQAEGEQQKARQLAALAQDRKKEVEALAREREVILETKKQEDAGRETRIRDLEALVKKLEEPLIKASATKPPAPPDPPTATPSSNRTADELGLRAQARPFRPGASFGTGSACCIVKDSTGRRFLLGLAGVFGGSNLKSALGTEIHQPNPALGGQAVARLVKSAGSEFTAAALAELLPGAQFLPTLPDGKTLKGIARVRKGDRVFLLGSGSGLSESSVISADLNEIVITRVSAGGDAGGPVFTGDGMLAGILWGGAADRSLVMPPERMLLDLGVQFDNSGALLEGSAISALRSGCAPVGGSPYLVLQETPLRLIEPRMLGLVYLDSADVQKPGEVSDLSVLIAESGKSTTRAGLLRSAAIRRTLEFRKKGATLDFQFQGSSYRVEILEIRHSDKAKDSVLVSVCELPAGQ